MVWKDDSWLIGIFAPAFAAFYLNNTKIICHSKRSAYPNLY